MRRRACGVLAALALAGCGTSGLSPSQLAASANRLCDAANQRMNAISLPEAPSAGKRFLSRGIAIPHARGDGAARARGDGTFRTAVTATAAELAALRFTLKGLQAGNDPVVAIKTLEQQLLPLEAKANQAWQSLGIRACVSR